MAGKYAYFLRDGQVEMMSQQTTRSSHTSGYPHSVGVYRADTDAVEWGPCRVAVAATLDEECGPEWVRSVAWLRPREAARLCRGHEGLVPPGEWAGPEAWLDAAAAEGDVLGAGDRAEEDARSRLDFLRQLG